MDFELLSDSIEQIVHVIDKNCKLVYINKRGIDELDKRGKQGPYLGYHIKELFPFLSQNNLDEYRQIFNTGKILHNTVNADIEGQKFTYQLKRLPVVNNGTIAHVMTILEDMTRDNSKEKEALEKLKAEQIKFKTIFYTSPNSITIHRMDGTYVDVNEQFSELTGYAYEDVVGKTTKDINIWINPNDREKLLEDISRNGFVENLEADFRMRNGNVRTGLISASIITLNAEEHIISVIRDITERDAIKRKLEENEWKYRTTFDVIREGLMDFDLINDRANFSDSFYKMLGFEPNEFENTNEKWTSLLHPDDKIKLEGAVKDHLNGNTKEVVVEYRIKNKRGQWQWLKTKGKVVLFTSYGKPKRFLAAIEDIDAVKKYEIDILEQNALLQEKNTEIEEMVEHLKTAKEKAEESDRLKSQFLNNISHEIRTPMNGIFGFSDYLDNPGISVEERKSYIKIIQDCSHQLLKIVEDILEISTLETKQVRTVIKETLINEAMLEVFSIFDIKAKEKGIALYLKNGLSDEEGKIFIDKEKFLKIISNLVENAIKFTQKGFVEIGSQLIDNELRVYVRDTGIGIPAEKRQLIFKRFAQVDREASLLAGGGLGISLSIAKENTELLGGKIDFESEVGKGSTFFLSFPYKSTRKGLQKTGQKDLKTCKILVAEDEEINYLVIETFLKKQRELNFEIIHAKNGVEAVETSKENPDLDLILMDIKMPLLNGYDATVQIKKIYPNLPIIALTAYSNPEDIRRALSAGCKEFISKPIDKMNLQKLLVKYCN